MKRQAGGPKRFPGGLEKCAGSVTVFMGMTIMVLMSLLFTLSETLRYLALDRSAELLTVRTEESMNALYNRILWDEFGILGMDMTLNMPDAPEEVFLQKVMTVLEENGNPDNEAVEFLRIAAETCVLSSYGVYTDQNGAPFIKAGALRATGTLPAEVLSSWQNDADAIEDKQKNGEDVDDILMSGEDALKSANESATGDEAAADDAASAVSPEIKRKSRAYEGKESPMALWRRMQKRGTLALVLPAGKTVSQGTIELSETVSHRSLAAGRGSPDVNLNVTAKDKLLFEQYILTELGSFTEPRAGTGLSYGAEYVLVGLGTDEENLERTILYLLALRETVNLTAIQQDQAKMAEAEAFAVALASISGNPAVIEAVQKAIIAVWALVESVLDLRLLLNGGKAALLKTPAEWTSDLKSLGTCLQNGFMAKDCASGLTYTGYLRTLLFPVSQKHLAYRAMDVVEQAIRADANYTNVRMDRMLYFAECKNTLTARPLFFSFVPQVSDRIFSYEFETTGTLRYLP